MDFTINIMDDKRITKNEFIVGCIIALGLILICGTAETIIG